MTTDAQVGANLSTLRGEMTQTQLAAHMKAAGHPFHQQTVQRIETGLRPLRIIEAEALAYILDTEMGALLEDPAEAKARAVWEELDGARAQLAEAQDRYDQAFRASVDAARSGPEFLEHLAQH